MSPEEALVVIRVAKAAFPTMRLDEYTPDVWVPALANYDYRAITDAIGRLVQKQPFASLGEIISEAKLHQRNGHHAVRNRQVFGEIEARKEAFDPDASKRAAAEARAAFQAAIDAKHAREAAETDEPEQAAS